MSETVIMVDRPVVRNGRSRAVTIPNHIADAIGLQIGDTVRLEVQTDGSIRLVPMETVHLSTGGTVIRPRQVEVVPDNKRFVPVIPEGRTIRSAKHLKALKVNGQ